MQLPTKIAWYALAVLQASCLSTVHLANFVSKSHDFLTRAIKVKVHWKNVFALLLDRNHSWYFIIDETEIDKSYSKEILGLSWIFSHLQGKYIFGYHIVVLAVYDGTKTIPLLWKFYQKGDEKTKIDLALELIKYALLLIPHPIAVLFDSFYAAETILKFLNSQGITFYTQLPKNRLLDHEHLAEINSGRPYWEMTGHIRGGIMVKVVKFRRKYFVTNRLDLTGKEIRREYSKRWRIEEVFRFCKTVLKLETCQMRDLRSQHNNVGVSFYLYTVLQDMAVKTQMTEYRVRDLVCLSRSISNIPHLMDYFNVA